MLEQQSASGLGLQLRAAEISATKSGSFSAQSGLEFFADRGLQPQQGGATANEDCDRTVIDGA
jgi:hypothetical protein